MAEGEPASRFCHSRVWRLVTDIRSGKLPANAAWAVLGNLIYVGGRILIVVILTKYFFSFQVGQVLYALAVVTPLSFLINMELRSVFVTDSKGQIKAGHCLSGRLVSNGVFLAVLLTLCVFQRDIWSEQKTLIILTAGVVRSAESWADVYLGVFQKCEQMKRWAISQSVKTGMVLLWVRITSPLTDNIIWILGGWLATTLLVAWFYDRVQANRLMKVRMQWDITIAGQLVRRGFPLGVFVALAILNHQVAQYFIAHERGDAAVAYFGVLILFVSGAMAVQNGVNQAILPRLASHFFDGSKEFGKLLGKVLGLSWLVMLGGVTVVAWKGDVILGILYNQEYAQYGGLFVLVVFSGCISLTGMILGDAIVACHRFKSRMIAVGLGLMVNIIICWQYVGQYGLIAAAWAAVVSSAVTALICGAILFATLRSKK